MKLVHLKDTNKRKISLSKNNYYIYVLRRNTLITSIYYICNQVIVRYRQANSHTIIKNSTRNDFVFTIKYQLNSSTAVQQYIK